MTATCLEQYGRMGCDTVAQLKIGEPGNESVQTCPEGHFKSPPTGVYQITQGHNHFSLLLVNVSKLATKNKTKAQSKASQTAPSGCTTEPSPTWLLH